MAETLQICDRTRPLSDILISLGEAPDLRCGGRGVCGRCRVKLLSGQWLVDGVAVEAPLTACACRTWLKSDLGVVERGYSQINPEVLTQWNYPLYEQYLEPVIGIDIGTTTLAAVKVCNGKIADRQGMLNPQFIFGDNIPARLTGDPRKLSNCLIEGVKNLIEQLNPAGVKHIGIAGNCAMSCYFHQVAPDSLGFYPFTPPQCEFPDTVDILPGYVLHTVPAISGFLGGDITAGLGEVNLQPGEMLVDLGTNCEIILRTSTQYFGTSAAAGPAFEGAGIGCGIRAGAGGIIHYFGVNQLEVLGDNLPAGICGSALIDLLAVERRAGKIDENGRFTFGSGTMEFAPGLIITEAEIASLLLAKAAVAAGIGSLERFAGEKAHTIYLAGAFASHLDIVNAVRIGLLPAGRVYRSVGNVSLAGAVKMALTPMQSRERLLKLSRLPQEYSLNDLPGFNENFIASLSIP